VWCFALCFALWAICARAEKPPTSCPTFASVLEKADRIAEHEDVLALTKACEGLLVVFSYCPPDATGISAAVGKALKPVLPQLAQFSLVYGRQGMPKGPWADHWKMVRGNVQRVLEGKPPGLPPRYAQLEMPAEVRAAIANVDAAVARSDLKAARTGIDEARAGVSRWIAAIPVIDLLRRWPSTDAELATLVKDASASPEVVKQRWGLAIAGMGFRSMIGADAGR
jgi:hypothetical protein